MVLKRLVILLLVLGLLFGGLFYLKGQQMQAMQAQMSAPRPPAVIAAAEALEELRQPILHSVGSLVAVNGIQVSPEVAGIVSEMLFDSGDTVEKGAVLIRLDAEVDVAALNALRADQRLAEIEYKRAADLVKKKAVSQSDFDKAQAAYQAAAARVAEQASRVARKSIRAPFSGLLGIRGVDLGQYINPGEGIVELQSFDPIYLDYALPEQQFRDLAVGQGVEARLEAFPGETFSGRISAIDAAVMEGTRSIRVRATLPNPDGRLRPGMFVEVNTLRGEPQTLVTIPQSAVAFNTYGDFVMVIESGEGGALTVKPRQVTSGAARDGRVAILKGLAAGERVVRAGHNKLRPGQAVSIDDSVVLDDAKVATP